MVFGMIVYIISTNNSMGFEKSEISTMAILLITFIGLINLIKVCLPMNFKRLAMILILTALFIFTSFCFKQLFFILRNLPRKC